MRLEILNNFTGDDKHDLDTSSPEGREQAAKMVDELIKSGSAVFLEREIGGVTHTYRVTGYNKETNKLTIRLDAPVNDPAVEVTTKKRRGAYRTRAAIAAESGRAVAVAPRAGG